jgi:hypothetical protein
VVEAISKRAGYGRKIGGIDGFFLKKSTPTVG